VVIRCSDRKPVFLRGWYLRRHSNLKRREHPGGYRS
jgi:hypothetical protein